MSKECPKGKLINPKTGRCVKKDGAIGRSLLTKKSGTTIPKPKKAKTDSESKKSKPKTKTSKAKRINKSKDKSPRKPLAVKAISATKSPTRGEIVALLSSTDTDSEIILNLRTLYGIKMKTPTKFTDLPPDIHKLIFAGSSPTSSKSLFLATKGVNKTLQDASVWKNKIKDEFGVVKIKKGESALSGYNKLSRYRSFLMKALAINRKGKHAIYFITKQAFLEELFPFEHRFLRESGCDKNSYYRYPLRSDGKYKAYIGDTKSEKDKDAIAKLSIMIYNGKLFLNDDHDDNDVSSEGIPSGNFDKLNKVQKKKL